jgi:Tfp pilus assembly protein PilV
MKKCHSDKNFAGFGSFRSAFSLVETAAALLILAVICSGVVVVFDNSMNSAANSALRMQAFEVAEENMEKLLASSSVSENVEYGYSEKYPAIEWQTTVETFYEPTTSRLWTRAVCSADFLDISGKKQKVELANWLTDLTQQQVIDLMKMKEQQKSQIGADKLLQTIEDAAEYAGVDVDTIQKWVDSGMPVTDEGLFIKDYLDLYKKHNGEPPPEEKSILGNKYLPLLTNPNKSGLTTPPTQPDQQKKPDDGTKKPDDGTNKPDDGTNKPDVDQKSPETQQTTYCGKTIDELNKMPPDKFWPFVQSCPELWIR